MKLGKNNKISTPNSDTFNLSISDLMSTLLAVFILVTCCLLMQKEAAIKSESDAMIKKKAEFEQKIQATTQLIKSNFENRNKILQKIENEMRQANFEVQIDSIHGVISIKDKEKEPLFASGSAELTYKARNLFTKLSDVLVEVLVEEYAKGVETIFVEGHTDDEPINWVKYPSNWQLSADRAIQTLEHMDKRAGGSLKARENAKGECVFSCSGYGAARPFDREITWMDRSKFYIAGREKEYEERMASNRRIDIRFAMTSITMEDVEKIGKQLKVKQ